MPMRSRLIITIPHFNNPTGLMLTIGSINESFSIDVIVVDDGSKNIFNEKYSKNNACCFIDRPWWIRKVRIQN